jgi:hypothetical protein
MHRLTFVLHRQPLQTCNACADTCTVAETDSCTVAETDSCADVRTDATADAATDAACRIAVLGLFYVLFVRSQHVPLLWHAMPIDQCVPRRDVDATGRHLPDSGADASADTQADAEADAQTDACSDAAADASADT